MNIKDKSKLLYLLLNVLILLFLIIYKSNTDIYIIFRNFVIVSHLIFISYTDINDRIIPNKATLSLSFTVIYDFLIRNKLRNDQYLWFFLCLVPLIFIYDKKKVIGGGDIKLISVCGLLLGSNILLALGICGISTLGWIIYEYLKDIKIKKSAFIVTLSVIWVLVMVFLIISLFYKSSHFVAIVNFLLLLQSIISLLILIIFRKVDRSIIVNKKIPLGPFLTLGVIVILLAIE